MPQKKPQETVTEENETVDRLRTEIKNLSSDNVPSSCEGKIRELHRTILAIKNSGKKEQLLSELKAFSYKGLNQELYAMVKENGLTMESLPLVLKYVTQKNELAEYLFVTPSEVIEKEGLDAVRKRLGPKLEVSGALLSKGIDINEEWAKKLVEKAPSQKSLARLSVTDLENLCKGASNRQMEDVSRIVRVAESHTVEKTNEDQQEQSAQKITSNKAIDKEKLEQAKALMNEAKETAKKQSEEAKKAVEERMKEISELLELPPDWNKQTGKTPDTLLGELNGIIDLFNNVVEPSAPYNSDHEVIQKASGGRALCGMYFSKYKAPSTAERPLIIMPSKVMLSSPNNSHQIRYLKFSASRAAANYVQAVKSSSTNVGFSVGGFFNLFVGEVHGSYGHSSEEKSEKSEKKEINQASVLQYIWTATKTFKIDQEQFILSVSARKHAKMLAKAINDAENLPRAESLMKQAQKLVNDDSEAGKTSMHTKINEILNFLEIPMDSKRQETGVPLLRKLQGALDRQIKSIKNPTGEKEQIDELAKRFLDRYGSHMPAGLHTLGGILFRIVDAQSEKGMNARKLTEKSAQQLQGQLSVGFLGGAFGIGASVSGEHSTAQGKTTAEEEKDEKTSYTFSSQAMGPAATDPATFSKLLGNNSTWALIDRGSPAAYIPVWEMISDLGSEFEGAARVLEKVWTDKEKKLKAQSRRLGKELRKIVEDDVTAFKNECLEQKQQEIKYNFLPSNGAQLVFKTISTINLTKENAYEIAEDMIMEDPRHRVCVVTLCDDGKYMVRSWESSDDAEMTFKSDEGKHLLLYSRVIFKWQDKIPRK